jgi:hypothetical protein
MATAGCGTALRRNMTKQPRVREVVLGRRDVPMGDA